MFGHSPSMTGKMDKFYFLPHEPGVSPTVADQGDDGREIEAKPADIAEEAFEPKPVNRNLVCRRGR
jgi:hypothetical protein